ncbi:hypothetical protein [Streptacidiphilus sp. PAMC 29251]
MIEYLAATQSLSASRVYFFAAVALLGALGSLHLARTAEASGAKAPVRLLLKSCAWILLICGVVLVAGEIAFA